MTDSAGLERGYRRLLACYPQPFRREQADEVLAVLMAGARPGQRRPGLAEAADVLKSALRMRFRPAGWGPGDGAWGDGLALFSVAAPLLLLAVAVLEVALPYRPPQTPQVARVLGSNFQIGGLPLLHFSGFLVALGGLAVIAALVLLGLRRLALAAIAASAVYWWVARHWIPAPLQLLCTSVFMLEGAALIASPAPRRGRALLTQGQGTALLLAAAEVQASTLLYEVASPPVRFLPGSPATVYLVISVVLAVAAAGLAVAVKMNRYFLLLLAVMFYPYVMELAFSGTSTDSDLIGHPTPAHLAVLFLPPLLAACAVPLTAVTPPRYLAVFRSPDPDKPRPT